MNKKLPVSFLNQVNDGDNLFAPDGNLNDQTNEAAKPPFWKEDWLEEIMRKTDLNRMSPEERVMFDMSLVKEVMYQKKLEEVAEKAKIHKATETVILSHKKGLDASFIADITELPIEKVNEIIQEYEQKLK